MHAGRPLAGTDHGVDGRRQRGDLCFVHLTYRTWIDGFAVGRGAMAMTGGSLVRPSYHFTYVGKYPSERQSEFTKYLILFVCSHATQWHRRVVERLEPGEFLKADVNAGLYNK